MLTIEILKFCILGHGLFSDIEGDATLLGMVELD